MRVNWKHLISMCSKCFFWAVQRIMGSVVLVSVHRFGIGKCVFCVSVPVCYFDVRGLKLHFISFFSFSVYLSIFSPSLYTLFHYLSIVLSPVTFSFFLKKVLILLYYSFIKNKKKPAQLCDSVRCIILV